MDWIIRVQGAYAILAGILATSAGTALRAYLRGFTHVPLMWITPIWLLATAGVFCLLLFCAIRLGSLADQPDFQLFIPGILWVYDERNDRTNFYFAARLVNRGSPSVTQNWTATYTVGTTTETMRGFYLVGAAKLNIGNERLTIENSELLTVKTAEKAVERGGAVHGRLLFVLPGDRDAQLKALQHRIQVRVEDYLGRSYVAEYWPSATPTTTLMRHPFERGEFLSDGEAGGEIPQQ